MPHEENEEPDVTPLINVNLMILVMALAIASHAARLLPLAMPKAERTELVSTASAVPLTLLRGERLRLGEEELKPDDLPAALATLKPGTAVTVRAEPGVRYAALVRAVEGISAVKGLEVALGDLAGTANTPPEGAAGQ